MRLYQGCSKKTARHVLDFGFEGELWLPLEKDRKGGIVRDESGKPAMKGEVPERWCVFRSGSFVPGRGQEDESPLAVIPEGACILMIEVPEDVARKYEVVERPEGDTGESEGTPSLDREFWFTQDVANGFRDTIKVYDRDGAEIPAELLDT